ncbi:MAG: DUF3556 domain-containing protein [bacterium]|nr:DUF3556 domain-containing protein [bacterium]
MNLMSPTIPEYDPVEARKLPFAEQARLVCKAWALEGYGSPLSAYLFYLLKIGLYIWGWAAFCSFSGGAHMGDLSAAGAWMFTPVAFQKAVLWSMLFEVLGFGCGSGPLTARYLPPFGGLLYFLRPGTTKLPLFQGAPVVGGMRRSLLDAIVYAGLVASLFAALIHPDPGALQFVPIVLLTVFAGVLDKTIFLAARAEHYWVTVVVFAFEPNWIAGAMVVQLALWFFAGFSKLNHHFATVVCVMASNGPFTPFKWFRKSMYRDYPNDLRPSQTALVKSWMGTALELSVPTVFLIGAVSGSWNILLVGLVLMVLLHAYITSNVPMGVPLEWNVMVLYGGFFLFYANGHINPLNLSWPIAVFLILMSIVVPIAGNRWPAKISFLLAMRYYAGNWANSVWLFKGDSHKKLEKLTKLSPWVPDQLKFLYNETVAEAISGKVQAFRLMHMHGRAYQKLLPLAVNMNEYPQYTWMDGELVAGMVLGYNFGEGHLHGAQLLRSVQAQCGFEPGELRCVCLESQPLGKSTLDYNIYDASEGLQHSGQVDIKELRELQPWPTTG